MAVFTATGAWTVGNVNITRNPNINWAADAAASAIGLFGDATVAGNFVLPAGWVANDTGAPLATIVAAPGCDAALSAYCAGAITPNQRTAYISARVTVTIQYVTDPLTALIAAAAVSYTMTVVYPWQVLLVGHAAPNAACQSEVWLEYLWSASAGRA